jgi:adenylate kinase
MQKMAVILYGAPGSGKGTQANLLAAKFGLIHLDTGKFLEAIVHDPARQKEKTVKRERVLFDGGKLMTPSFVSREVILETKRIHDAGFGIIFSGFPRTISEAEVFYPILKKLYGKNVAAFALDVPRSFSLKRNSARRICKVCGYALLTAFYPTKNPKHCPVCGGPFYKRSLDNPRVIEVRLKEYEDRTRPIFALMSDLGYRLHHVMGTPAPYVVFEKLVKFLKTSSRS